MNSIMKKITLASLSFLLIWSMIPDDTYRRNTFHKDDPAQQEDGPYVLYKKDQVFAKYILETNGIKTVQADSLPLSEKKKIAAEDRY